MTELRGDLTVTTVGRIGHLLLNRPAVLNALSLQMIREIDEALRRWQHDDSVEAVVVTGAGDGAFCAGGDVKSICLAGQAGEVGCDGLFTADFFRDEYTLIHRIATYPKPYVSYLDGVTMGAGVGISILGSHRIASEYMTFGMPETKIGFFPDVGGSYFMSQLGSMGLLLALTGQSLDFSAALELGIASHFVPREPGRELVDCMANDGVESTLSTLCQTIPPSDPLQRWKALADRCFVGSSIDEVFESLERATTDAAVSDLAEQTLERLRQRSPTSLLVTFEELSRGRHMTLAECLIMEYRLSQAFMRGHDFYEGIRALLIDKDHSPNWSPNSVENVDEDLVLEYFQALGDRELQL